MDRFRLYTRGKKKTYWADFGLIGGVSQRRSTGTTSKHKAVHIARAIEQQLAAHRDLARISRAAPVVTEPAWIQFVQREETTARFNLMWKNAKQRAKKNGILWALSSEDFWLIVKRSNGQCAVTGLRFAMDDTKHNPEQPSLDRINSALGYSPGNCRLVLLAVNYAMNTWGERNFKKIAISFAVKALKQAASSEFSWKID